MALVVVAIVGMIVGVIAANIVVTSNSFTGEAGTYHNNAGTFTVTDRGLMVVANSGASNITSIQFGATGTDKALQNAMTAGRWMEAVEFTTTLTDSTSHTATITVRTGTGPNGGTLLVTQAMTLQAPTATSTAKITVYLDLGSADLAGPVTVYVTVG